MFQGYVSPLTDKQRMQEISANLDRWRTYVSSDKPVERGSSLARDDELLPRLPVSALAWHSLSTAVDHLDMFMQAVRTRQLHPLAPATLARSGMLGGAHALWLLEGTDRAGRQKRGLRMAHAEFENDRKMIHDIATMATDDPATGLAEAEPHLSQRGESIEAVVAAGSSVGMTRGQVCARIDETTLLTEVTDEMAKRERDTDGIQLSYRVIWRMYSATAHGLRWASFYRADLRNAEPSGTDGTVYARMSNELQDLTMAASAVAVFLSRGVTVFEMRRKPYGA